MLKKMYACHQEGFWYLIFGLGTVCVNWGSYSICVKYISLGIMSSNIISWILATLFAFITNKIWVFGSKCFKLFFVLKELGKFISTRVMTGLFEIIAVPLLVLLGLNQSVFGIEGIVSKVFVSIIVVLLNYFFSKKWIFKK